MYDPWHDRHHGRGRAGVDQKRRKGGKCIFLNDYGSACCLYDITEPTATWLRIFVSAIRLNLLIYHFNLKSHKLKGFQTFRLLQK